MIKKNEIILFINNFWKCDLQNENFELTLAEIGITSADKENFLIEFFNEFEIEVTNFPSEKYIEEFSLIKMKNNTVLPITLNTLLKWANEGRWSP